MSTAFRGGEMPAARINQQMLSLSDYIFYFCMKASIALSVYYFGFLVYTAMSVPELGFLKLLPFFGAAVIIPFYAASLIEDYES